jgi:hypothetical protein
MHDTSPAVFIRKETASLVADRVKRHRNDQSAAFVAPHRRHGEMQGWVVRLPHPKGGSEPLTNDAFEQMGEAA